jgi:hypothetical protein
MRDLVWGQIFMVDNIAVTLAPPPVVLVDACLLPGVGFQFTFTNTPGAAFIALTTADTTLPLSNWTAVGNVSEISAGKFQFTDAQGTNGRSRFYCVRSQ